MRGKVDPQATLFTTISPEKRVPAEHPIRKIKELVDEQLRGLSPVFDGMYAQDGRSSVAPERLLKAQLLIALFSIRSERQFCERLEYDLLFRYFLDMSLEDEAWDATVFTKNRDRLIESEVAKRFFEGAVRKAKQLGLISQEHFTVDGTLIEAWASLKSFRRQDEQPEDREPPDDPGNPSVDFRGEKRSNATHESTTDPESRLARKSNGTTARLSYSGHALMENRNGLCVDFRIATADGYAEREEALAMLRRLRRRRYTPKTLGGDKGYDKGHFPQDVLDLGIAPHIAVNEKGGAVSSPARRFVNEAGYATSQCIRKRVEEIFGWMKTVGGFRRTRYQGQARTQTAGYFVATAYNLVRMCRLMAAPA